MYMIEGNPSFTNAQPLKFLSIPTTSWCIFVTMSSVGYGDMFPVSDQGRVLGSVVMVSGILTLAVPITLIGNRFNDVWVEHKKREKKIAAIQSQRLAVQNKKPDANPEAKTATTMNGKDPEPEVNTKLQSKSAKLMAKGILEHCFKVTKDDCFTQAKDIVWTEQDQIDLEKEKAAEKTAVTPRSGEDDDAFNNPLAANGGTEISEKEVEADDTDGDSVTQG
jgi:hypothetical protein